MRPTPASDFLDPNDPVLFPRLSERELDYVAERASRVTYAPGDQVFAQGQRNTPFYVVEAGAVDILDRQPEGDRYFTQCRAGTFIGDIAVFTGEPTIAAGVAAEPTSLLEISPNALRELVARSSDLGDLLCARWSRGGSGFKVTVTCNYG
jgi:thioredoxin reductase (NADPH)